MLPDLVKHYPQAAKIASPTYPLILALRSNLLRQQQQQQQRHREKQQLDEQQQQQKLVNEQAQQQERRLRRLRQQIRDRRQQRQLLLTEHARSNGNNSNNIVQQLPWKYLVDLFQHMTSVVTIQDDVTQLYPFMLAAVNPFPQEQQQSTAEPKDVCEYPVMLAVASKVVSSKTYDNIVQTTDEDNDDGLEEKINRIRPFYAHEDDEDKYDDNDNNNDSEEVTYDNNEDVIFGKKDVHEEISSISDNNNSNCDLDTIYSLLRACPEMSRYTSA